MPPTPEPPFDPQQQGISLDELAAAFAQVMGTEPRAASAAAPSRLPESAENGSAAANSPDALAKTSEPREDSCPISPRTILEAMLFVGDRDNRPLTPRRAAELMRDVAVEEIPPLVEELNRSYEARGAPYEIIGEGDGYRLAIRDELRSLRDRFHGRVREARLSQAAVDVLALVAYEQPVTGEKISRLRGRPSSHIVAHLVRRGLLRVERPASDRRTPHYSTTERFLRLFNLESLDDLPRSEDDNPS